LAHLRLGLEEHRKERSHKSGKEQTPSSIGHRADQRISVKEKQLSKDYEKEE